MSDEQATSELIALAKKDKLSILVLSREVMSGISNQITGVEHELLTVVRMQQKSYEVDTLSVSPRPDVSILFLLCLFLSLSLSIHLGSEQRHPSRRPPRSL
jgi:hypothetical protein